MNQDKELMRIKLTEEIQTVPIRVLGRSHLACVRCRTQKTKCDGEKPTCKTCLLSDKECFYESKDRKIILLESQLNKLQDRIKYLEVNLKKLTLKTDIKIIDSSDERHEQIIKNESADNYQESSYLHNKDNNNNNNDSPEDVLHQQYPLFPNPLFGDPENFNQHYLNPTAKQFEEQRISVDKIVIDSKPTDLMKSLESSSKNLVKFDYMLQNCLGEFAYFDSVNPTVSNFHANSKHYLSDNYFDYPFNGYITLPDKEYCLQLFDIVYKSFCNTFYLFDREVFLQQIDLVYENLNAQKSIFLCKLLITLAIGEQLIFSKLSFDPNFTKRYGERINVGIAGLKFFTLAIQIFRYNHENFDISNIQTCLLIAYYEQILNRTTSLYAFYGLAMRLVIANNYHRKTHNDKIDPVMKEKSKRLFWSIYTLSAKCNAKLHLPLELKYTDTDVELPLENALDLKDGFKLDMLDLEVQICRYVDEIVRGVYSVTSRTFDDSYVETKNSNQKLQDKVNITLNLLNELAKVRQRLKLIFERVELEISTGIRLNNRDDLNIILTYNCAIIFITRPITLSFFRGLVAETLETRKIAQASIDASCEIIKTLQYLREICLLQTFDYWDNQYCFTALLILTVAGLAGITSPLSSVGVEIMAFMANSGNHSARSYFAKLITLEECLSASGHASIYQIPLLSLRTYPTTEARDTTLQDSLDNNKVLVKTEELSIQDLRKKQRKKKQPAKKAEKPPISSSSSSASSTYPPPSASQVLTQNTNYKTGTFPPEPQTHFNTNIFAPPPPSTTSDAVAPQLPRQPQQEASYKITNSLANSGFTTDPEFFNELVSNIQVWDNPFNQEFIQQQQQLQLLQQVVGRVPQASTGDYSITDPGPQYIPSTQIQQQQQQQHLQQGVPILESSQLMPSSVSNNQTVFNLLQEQQLPQQQQQQQTHSQGQPVPYYDQYRFTGKQ